jgi:hypothetical protein
MLVGSRSSLPFKMSSQIIIPKINLESSTVLENIPTVSRECAYGTNPHLERRPYDGLNPTTPQYAAGKRTDPPVSEPKALH